MASCVILNMKEKAVKTFLKVIIMKINHKGQSTFEYVLTVAAVLVVVVVFLNPGGAFRGVVEKTMNNAVDSINLMVNSINLL